MIRTCLPHQGMILSILVNFFDVDAHFVIYGLKCHLVFFSHLTFLCYLSL